MTIVSSVFEVADRYVERNAMLDPIYATHLGTPVGQDRLTDFSLSGLAAQDSLNKDFLATMTATEPQSEAERIARDVFLERLSHWRDRYQAGEEFSRLAVMWTPVQSVRSVFDLMPRESNDHWKVIAKRMTAVPETLEGIKESLREGQRLGISASRRQARACAQHALAWSGSAPGTSRFFGGLHDEYVARASTDRKLQDALRKGANSADGAYAHFADFLTDEYALGAPEQDGVGHERYTSAAREYLGASIDPQEAYAWGWEELGRIRSEIAKVCAELGLGANLRETVEALNSDYSRALQGEEALRDWLQALMARTVAELNVEHFDIPEPLRHLDVRIAPPGGSAAKYYVGPSEDFTRPGTYWYPVNGQRHFPVWKEVSTAYHEGVPGHHLQLGYATYSNERLTRFQRKLYIAGYGEGWALYAERLMDELGYLDRPEYRLDMLLQSLFRAARVVVDIGMHLGLTIPTSESFHPGEPWSADLGYAFVMENSAQNESFVRSEIDRYLGMPAQAISYKLGERLWLEARSEAQERAGADFDLKRFHMNALSLGPMGLEQLKSELARQA